jgi:lysophospholipase L1-like esterase
MIDGKFHFCGVAESQLDRAVAFLGDHQGQVSFITIDIGANDIVFPLVGGTCVDPDSHLVDGQCVADKLPGIQANLAYILETLQAAAPGVPIIGMHYYDPGLGDWVLWFNGKALVRHNHPVNVAFDAALVDTYQEEGVIVADVRGPDAFDTETFIDKVWTERFGLIPLNVAKACWLTLYCTSESLDGHPNCKGFWVIAEAFETVLPT